MSMSYRQVICIPNVNQNALCGTAGYVTYVFVSAEVVKEPRKGISSRPRSCTAGGVST